MHVDALIGLRAYEPHTEYFNVTNRETAVEEILAQLNNYNGSLKPEQEKRCLFGIIEEMKITNNRQFHNKTMSFYNMVKRESSRASGDEWCKKKSAKAHMSMLLAGDKAGIEEMQKLIRESPFKDDFKNLLEYEAQDDE